MVGLLGPGTTEEDSLATIRGCFDLGINHLDTAYMYGRNGESERLIAQALDSRRDEMVIATKCGAHWKSEDEVVDDAALGFKVKGAGYRLATALAGPLIQIRMYEGALETVKGFSKNVDFHSLTQIIGSSLSRSAS